MTAIKFNRLLSHYKSDRKAVLKLYEYYYPLIVIHINSRFRGRPEGKDIGQQFFVHLFSVEIKEKIICPTAWVYKVADNLALGEIRKSVKQRAAEKLSAPPDKVYIPDCILDQLDCLNSKEKMVVFLKYWEMYRLVEIAELMKLNYRSVKYLHKTAKAKLKKQYKKEKDL